MAAEEAKASSGGGAGEGGAEAVGIYEAVDAVCAKTPKPERALKYGTAGFRSEASLLPSTSLRMGCLAAMRSREGTQAADGTPKAIGVMVTASHNPVQDNGLKITDPDGGMMSAAWEKHATTLANAADDAVGAALKEIAEAEGVDLATKCAVFVARDTRPTSKSLADLVIQGAMAAGAEVLDYGLLTTPQLHHMVLKYNTGAGKAASISGYCKMLRTGYEQVLQGAPANADARGPVIFDGACGIGADQIPQLSETFAGLVNMEIRNKVGEGELNGGVGAEHAQKSRTPPAGFDATADAGKRLASLDGDADRLVYHYFDNAGTWHLIDGDRIAALAATFLKDQLGPDGLGWSIYGDEVPDDADPDTSVTVGVVQTAYANGASSKYIRETLGLPVPLAKTGVKYVHHRATEYDIGVYFEANGHGTVLITEPVLKRLHLMDVGSLTDQQKLARSRLIGASVLINQAIGDALSDSLFCEAVLALKGWGVTEWDGLYDDLPSRQTKLAVEDRTIVVTNADETKVLEPASLQAAIDAAVAEVDQGRAFVRPSGTEDVVRVYAEATTEAAANDLAHKVALAAYEHANGVGDKPAPFA